MAHVKQTPQYQHVPVVAWSDSMVTLCWIRSHASRWKPFVANRVVLIQSHLPAEHWRYVPTKDNPADIVSRGTTPAQLQESSLWWKGPPWLERGEWPAERGRPVTLPPEENRRDCQTFTTVATPTDDSHDLDYLLGKFSSLKKLLRVTALLLRFAKFTLLRDKPRPTMPDALSPDEINTAPSDSSRATALPSRRNRGPATPQTAFKKVPAPEPQSISELIWTSLHRWPTGSTSNPRQREAPTHLAKGITASQTADRPSSPGHAPWRSSPDLRPSPTASLDISGAEIW